MVEEDHSSHPTNSELHLAPAAGRDLEVLAGTLPLEACVRRVLETNPSVRAARFNVEAVRQRIPQVTALDDPILSNTIFPIPSVAPQYSLMGYMPYGALLAQQFPWCGTLRLRGHAAEQDVRIALFELAATELDAVASVKRAYFDLHLGERTEALLRQNRKLAEEFLKIARVRYPASTATQPDVLRAEVAVSDIDREIENNVAALNDARAELARLMNLDPETRDPDRVRPAGGFGSGPSWSGSASSRWPAAPIFRAGWRPSSATRRPSSWRESGIIRTSVSAWSIRTWRRPMRRHPRPRAGCRTSASSWG